MGDTFGAWIVHMPGGRKNTIICKAYALAQSIARRRYPTYLNMELVEKAVRGEVVVVEDDDTERIS